MWLRFLEVSLYTIVIIESSSANVCIRSGSLEGYVRTVLRLICIFIERERERGGEICLCPMKEKNKEFSNDQINSFSPVHHSIEPCRESTSQSKSYGMVNRQRIWEGQMLTVSSFEPISLCPFFTVALYIYIYLSLLSVSSDRAGKNQFTNLFSYSFPL